MFSFNRKGVVLLLLLAMILFTTILAGIVSYLVLNQSRLGQHQINRIKAYYAALAGINLALEKLRVGSWTTVQTYALCRDDSTCSDLTVDRFETDWDIPYRVDISIGPYVSGLRTVDATVNYTYTP